MQFKYLKSTRIKCMEPLVGPRCAREQSRTLYGNAFHLIAADWSFQAFNSLAQLLRLVAQRESSAWNLCEALFYWPLYDPILSWRKPRILRGNAFSEIRVQK